MPSWWSYPLLRRVVGFRGVALWALLCRGGCTRRAVGIVLRWTGAAHTRRRLVVLHGTACRSLTNVLRTHRVAVAIGAPLCGSNRRAANNHGCSNADCSEIDLHDWFPTFMLLKILQRAKCPTVPLHEEAVRLGPGPEATTEAPDWQGGGNPRRRTHSSLRRLRHLAHRMSPGLSPYPRMRESRIRCICCPCSLRTAGVYFLVGRIWSEQRGWLR